MRNRMLYCSGSRRINRLDRKVTVEQIGGPLYIEWEEESGHMFMTGPSHTVFESEIDASHIIGTAE